MKTEIGKVIELCWEDGTEEVYVRGHMDPAEAHKILMDFYEGEIEGKAIPLPRAAWARWSCEIGPDGPWQVLRVYEEPGRGRFAVMVATLR